MELYGIIGHPLGHSQSPAYFNGKFGREGIDARYEAFDLADLREFPALVEGHPELRGLNVTIPHKQGILPYLDAVSDEARAVGAVNCIRIGRRAGKPFLTGYNTDVEGFRRALLAFLPELRHRGAAPGGALVLGNGGAARAVRHVLRGLGMEVLAVSRTPHGEGEIAYAEAGAHLGECPLVVNTTPLGMYPRTGECPDIPYGLLTPGHRLFDLVYNPPATAFMERGRLAGARVCNGLAMLTAQAEAGWEIWQQQR